MKATPSEPPEKLGLGDLLVRPRIPSVLPPPEKRSAGEAAPTIAQGKLWEAATVEMPPSTAKRRGPLLVAAVALVAIAGVGVGLALQEGDEGVRGEPIEPIADVAEASSDPARAETEAVEAGTHDSAPVEAEASEPYAPAADEETEEVTSDTEQRRRWSRKSSRPPAPCDDVARSAAGRAFDGHARTLGDPGF